MTGDDSGGKIITGNGKFRVLE